MSESGDEDRVDDQEEEKLFHAERAKTGRAKCKKCKNPIESGTLRLAKLTNNPFGSGKIKVWHHLNCIFEVFKRQRATTPKIEKINEVGGFEALSEDDIEAILNFLPDEARSHWQTLKKELPLRQPPSQTVASGKKKIKKTPTPESPAVAVGSVSNLNHKDNSLREFRKICLTLSNDSSYLQKTKLLQEFFTKGSDGKLFKGDLLLWCRMLLPGIINKVYKLQSKQLVKIFSRIFETDLDEMLVHLEQGDVALTVSEFFTQSEVIKPAAKSTLSLQETDQYLQKLSTLTKEDEQQKHLSEVCKKCTPNDLQIFVRFIKHDLKINAGAKPILNAVHPDAYDAFQTCRDLNLVIDQVAGKKVDKQHLSISVKLLTPVLPMLAGPCKSLEATVKKHKNGLYAEIKYDGERVQLHKQGFDFKYFSRSLKPVLAHKVNHFDDFIRKAFPSGDDIILDCEVLMIDTKTGDPLPFGTLGKHKKNEFQDANTCLFVFDCIYFNGKSYLDSSLQDRHELLQKNMREIPNHIQFSQKKLIKDLKDLESMLTDILDRGLEGLVLKDPMGTYEPGKRHWIKVKRDYLFEGKAADTVDLVVLGAWYGTGHKGGLMNVFLMGCYNPQDRSWRSVTKVHGLDDETIATLQTKLDMVKISRDVNKIPKWLNVTRTMVPDLVAKNPKVMPVWEITGHEYTKHEVHTADGISIRFPRVVKIREDKTWENATTLDELKKIHDVSKTNAGSRLMSFFNPESEKTSPPLTPSPSKKRKKGTHDPDASDSEMSDTTAPINKIRKCNVDKDSSEPVKRKEYPTNVLPDLLAGKVIRIQGSTRLDLECRRHFIAYGATVVDDSRKKVTHEIVTESFLLVNKGKKMKVLLKKI